MVLKLLSEIRISSWHLMLLATCGSVNQLPINTSPSLYALTPDLVETVLEKIGIMNFS